MIESFYVNNYKCLVDVRIPLTPIHVIIGQNDSGKTSVLEAMLALSRSTTEPVRHIFPVDQFIPELFHTDGVGATIEFEICISADEMVGRSAINYHLSLGPTHPVVRTEWIENGGRTEIPREAIDRTGVARGVSNPRMTAEQREDLNWIAKQLGSASILRFEPKLMVLPAPIVPSRKFHLEPDGSGLATFLDDILGNDAERFLALRREFCEFFPQFRSIKIESVPTQFPNSQGVVPGKAILFELANGRTIRAQQASDGAILFLGLLALIHSPEPPKLLLIEEPEKGVYPKRLEEVIGLIRRLQEDPPSGRPAPQIIMTTHSPYLLSSFRPEEVTLMVRRDGGRGPVEARPLRDAPHIEERLGRGEFYLGELWYNLSEDELFAHADA